MKHCSNNNNTSSGSPNKTKNTFRIAKQQKNVQHLHIKKNTKHTTVKAKTIYVIHTIHMKSMKRACTHTHTHTIRAFYSNLIQAHRKHVYIMRPNARPFSTCTYVIVYVLVSILLAPLSFFVFMNCTAT